MSRVAAAFQAGQRAASHGQQGAETNPEDPVPPSPAGGVSWTQTPHPYITRPILARARSQLRLPPPHLRSGAELTGGSCSTQRQNSNSPEPRGRWGWWSQGTSRIGHRRVRGWEAVPTVG